jgi:hypothetical protein
LAATIAIAGGVAGLALGIDSYRGSQRHIDSFERVAIPGAMALQISEPTGRVLYYEGDDTVRFNHLSITVTDPAGAPVEVNRYVGEMIYETLDLTHGRAVATFNATQTGTYDIDVIGVDTGQLVVGDSFSRRALPGVLTGLAIAGVSIIAGFVLWLLTLIQRSQRGTDR